MATSFGIIIRQARIEKAYSQRQLAELVPMDFTYLSKLENDRVDTPPSEEIIRSLARYLDLNEEELVFLAGRIPQCYEKVMKQNYKNMPELFRKLHKNIDREFRQELERTEIQAESEKSDIENF